MDPGKERSRRAVTRRREISDNTPILPCSRRVSNLELEQQRRRLARLERIVNGLERVRDYLGGDQ